MTEQGSQMENGAIKWLKEVFEQKQIKDWDVENVPDEFAKKAIADFGKK